jgi:excisionase family DNA binding protein
VKHNVSTFESNNHRVAKTHSGMASSAEQETAPARIAGTVSEPLLDCVRAAALLGDLHPKTVERWAREGRIPAYRYFKRWRFRASELETWLRSHVNSVCHPCRFKEEGSDGT